MVKKSQDILDKEHYEMLMAKKNYEEMNKPWYKKLEPWKLILTTAAAFLTAVILYKNGAFDFQSKALEVKRNNLEYDVKRFSNEKDSMFQIRDRLENENKVLVLRNLQIQIANKRAYESLDQRGKYFADVFAKNVELEKKNQRLESELNNANNLTLTRFSNSVVNTTWPMSIDQKGIGVSFAGNNNQGIFDISHMAMPSGKYVGQESIASIISQLPKLNTSSDIDWSKYVGNTLSMPINSTPILSSYNYTQGLSGDLTGNPLHISHNDSILLYNDKKFSFYNSTVPIIFRTKD